MELCKSNIHLNKLKYRFHNLANTLNHISIINILLTILATIRITNTLVQII